MNQLERCFEGTPDMPPRLIEQGVDVDAAKSHLDKAEHNLHAAQKMAENKFFDWQIVCAYYSMYHATMAALFLIGLEARSHECAIAAFEAFYINKKVPKEYIAYLKNAKQLSKSYSDTLANAKTERIKASYGLGEIKSEEASKVMSNARAFVSEIKTLVYAASGHKYMKPMGESP